MAREAPAHAQRFLLRDHLHLVDAAVAFHATHASGHVGRMTEVGKVRQIVHANPLHGHSRRVTLVQGRQVRAFLVNLRVTVHTRLRRRNRGLVGVLHRVMAVPAVDAQLPSVHVVAERNRLDGLIPDIRRQRTEPVGHQQRRIQRPNRCQHA